MKASEHISEFKNWACNSPFPEIDKYFSYFKDAGKDIDDYLQLESSIGLKLPDSFMDLIKKKGRFVLNLEFIDPIDIFQDYEDSLNKRFYWHIGAPSFNGLVIMTPDEMINAYEAIQFALGKNHPRGKYWYPIATTRSDMEEGWLIDQYYSDSRNNNPIAPFYTDSIFRYDNTLEDDEKLTMSVDNFDDFIGDYLFRLKRQLLKIEKQELRILIDEQVKVIKSNIR